MKVPLRIIYKKEKINISTEVLDRIEHTLNHYRDIYLDDIKVIIGYVIFYLYSPSDDIFIKVIYSENHLKCKHCNKPDCYHILYLIIEICGVYQCAHYLKHNIFDKFHHEYMLESLDILFKITI